NVNLLGIQGAVGDRWRDRFSLLFNELGYEKESYGAGTHRTPGDIGYDFETQVAVLSDWIDEDSTSFSSNTFPGKGFESGAPPGFFFNRELKNINELLLVPGMTRERLSRSMPFIRVNETAGDSSRVNVNTAKYETLVALGYPETIAQEIVLGQTQG